MKTAQKLALFGAGALGVGVSILAYKKYLESAEVVVTETIQEYELILVTNDDGTEEFNIKLVFADDSEKLVLLEDDFVIYQNQTESEEIELTYVQNEFSGKIYSETKRLYIPTKMIPKFYGDYSKAFSDSDNFNKLPEIISVKVQEEADKKLEEEFEADSDFDFKKLLNGKIKIEDIIDLALFTTKLNKVSKSVKTAKVIYKIAKPIIKYKLKHKK